MENKWHNYIQNSTALLFFNILKIMTSKTSANENGYPALILLTALMILLSSAGGLVSCSSLYATAYALSTHYNQARMNAVLVRRSLEHKLTCICIIFLLREFQPSVFITSPATASWFCLLTFYVSGCSNQFHFYSQFLQHILWKQALPISAHLLHTNHSSSDRGIETMFRKNMFEFWILNAALCLNSPLFIITYYFNV